MFRERGGVYLTPDRVGYAPFVVVLQGYEELFCPRYHAHMPPPAWQAILAFSTTEAVRWVSEFADPLS